MTVGEIIYEFYFGVARRYMILYEREMNLIGLTRFMCLQEVGDITETRRNWAPGFLSEQQNESIPLIREGRKAWA